MREKLYKILNKIYGLVLFISFFAGLLPIIPFIIAIIIGGPTGEAISLFLSKQYYPVIIALASISVIIGWVAMYVKNGEDVAFKKKKTDSKNKKQEKSE